ncbi:MAG TPA: MarR family winged helix-turn-helix transcriptional regulator [Baekduia sp.]|nr:MarR family winged helix-turn-helix transcriptional regulator [Baekduia sp.]
MLKWCGDRSSRAAFAIFAEHGLHPREYGLLNVLAASPGKAQLDLAEIVGIDSSTMVAVIDDLEAKGFAERRVDGVDRRRRTVHITKKGEAKLKELGPVVREHAEAQFGALSEDERAELLRLLRKIAGFDD